MDKIVKKPLKIDFHIHSMFSMYKDEYALVKDNDIKHIDVLVDKLNDNDINMCAITDHDYFSYELYECLKKYEGKNDLIKVFPGVEFSVGIKAQDNVTKQIHVICIFDDSDESKIKNIQNCIPFSNGKIDYGNDTQFFTEEKFISILRNIDLNLIAIAHQKSSVTSKKATKSKNDVSSLGSVKFNELISCEYFESFEFKNMKNGMFNKNFALKANKEYDQLRFITGSDCHVWKIYPKHDETERAEDFKFTYLKCLPTFRGLAMAFSDTRRISTNDFLYHPRTKKLDSISISISGKEYDIPLSDGLNVIIGDNSIGKSLLLHKLTNYNNLEGKPKIKDGYDAYLERNNIDIATSIDNGLIHTFDSQGEIRERFNSDKQDNKEFLQGLFPDDLDNSIYVSKVYDRFQNLYDVIENKFEYDKLKKQLNSLVLIEEEVELKNLSAKRLTNSKILLNKYKKIKNYYEKIVDTIEKDFKLVEDEKEIKVITDFLNEIKNFELNYKNLHEKESKESSKRDAINLGIKKFNEEVSNWRSDLENKKAKFENEDSDQLAQTIADLLIREQKLGRFEFSDENIPIEPEKIPHGQYVFVKQFKNCKAINKSYLQDVLNRVIKKYETIDTSSITEDKLRDIIKDTQYDTGESSLSILQTRVKKLVEDDFSSVPLITKNGKDVYEKLSNGMNSSIYFDVLSSDTKQGIYIVDQPEDDVSQTSIKKQILNNFKTMAYHRQIIMITHNPQFVVNLDVDNVICIFKDKNSGEITIKSGALEYYDDTTDILSMVALNLDGGVESIRKRWKRYDKGIDPR